MCEGSTIDPVQRNRAEPATCCDEHRPRRRLDLDHRPAGDAHRGRGDERRGCRRDYEALHESLQRHSVKVATRAAARAALGQLSFVGAFADAPAGWCSSALSDL